MSKKRLLLFGGIREEVNRGLVLGVCVVPVAAFDLAPGACLGVHAVDVRAICASLSKCSCVLTGADFGDLCESGEAQQRR